MYSFESNIRYSEVGANKKLTLLSLMDYFQDCSGFHSESKNVGVDYLAENNIAWILSYWHIVCDSMPDYTDKVEICTWPHDMKGFYGMRNFCMNDAEGKRLAYADSLWVMLDTNTGRPKKITQDIIDAYEYDPAIEMTEKGRKIPVPKVYEEGEHLFVPSYYIDTNNHMNNSKYVAVALSYVPLDAQVKELRVEYKKSAMLGDELVPRITREDDKITVVLCDVDGKPYAVVEFSL